MSESMQQARICELEKDMRFEGFLLVRSSDQRTGSNGGKYLDMTLADRTGEVNAKLWDGNTPPPPTGSVVKVRGGTLEYNGRLQLRVERMRLSAKSDGVDLSLLTPSAPMSAEEMLSQIGEAVDAMQSPRIQAVVREMLHMVEKKLPYYPAAQRIHHAERSGLLHHTTGMLKLAQAVLPLYPSLNADLVIAGVILHDLCKTEEIESDELGVVKDYSRSGLLLGHLVLGVERIAQAAEKASVSGEEVLLLQHMMLSHHGEEQYGSPRKPMFPEAELLHWIDLLDARMNEMQTALDKLKPGVFSEKIWSLERRLYKPDLPQEAED